MVHVTNALPGIILARAGRVKFLPLSAQEARTYLEDHTWSSAVGHADTACLFSSLLGMEIPSNRVSLPEDTLLKGNLVAGLYSGPRLPEGATTLPTGAKVEWFLVVQG